VQPGTQADSTIILTAQAVDLEGNKDVLAWRVCAEEDKDGWNCLSSRFYLLEERMARLQDLNTGLFTRDSRLPIAIL
jgi:transposase-like protein